MTSIGSTFPLGGPTRSTSVGADLLARPEPWRRLVMAALVAAGALPVLPPLAVTAWVAAWCGASAWEQRVARDRGYVGADTGGLLVTSAMALLCAVAAAALIARGDAGARVFAVALLGISGVNILLRYYASSRMLVASMAPLALVLGWLGWRLGRAGLQAGEPLRLLTPAATLGVFVLLLWPARNKLLETWRSLAEARERAERDRAMAEEASQAKSAFLATVSHEIRTPLNGVLGMIQALYTENRSLEEREQLRVARSSGETLLAILDDILDMSRIEAGQLRIEPVEFDMEHVVRGAVATFASAAARKQLAFAFSIEAAAKGRFFGDPTRIRQILHNLVSNAVKFTDRGGVAVSVSLAGGVLVLEVADSGCGVPPADRERIFQRFVQLDASSTRRAGGLGLGLAICRELAGLMGGTVTLTSRERRGSIFRVELPVRKLGESRPPEPPRAEAARSEAAARVRILAAEDNEVNRIVLQALLSQAEVDLKVVPDGADAVEAWAAGRWDLVLMDIQMPVMDGIAAAREIRGLEARDERARTPILALTANILPEQQAAYRAAGMDGVVAKPIQAEVLFQAIEQALEGALAEA